MKFIKLFFISVVFFSILLSAFSLFIPSHVQISKAMQIRTSPDSLWRVVDDFTTWKNWNTLFPGLLNDKAVYDDSTLKTENAEVKWKSREPGLRIAVIKRENRKPILSGWKLTDAGNSDELMVQWYIDIALRWYPWEKFAGMLYEKSYGDKLIKGLTDLKTMLENN